MSSLEFRVLKRKVKCCGLRWVKRVNEEVQYRIISVGSDVAGPQPFDAQNSKWHWHELNWRSPKLPAATKHETLSSSTRVIWRNNANNVCSLNCRSIRPHAKVWPGICIEGGKLPFEANSSLYSVEQSGTKCISLREAKNEGLRPKSMNTFCLSSSKMSDATILYDHQNHQTRLYTAI